MYLLYILKGGTQITRNDIHVAPQLSPSLSGDMFLMTQELLALLPAPNTHSLAQAKVLLDQQCRSEEACAHGRIAIKFRMGFMFS